MKCEKCGEEHNGNYGSGRFCSTECAHSRNISKKIYTKIAQLRKGKPGGMLGKNHTQETKDKISNNHARYWKNKNRDLETRKKISNTKKGCISSKKGVKLTEEQKRKISESKKNPSKKTRQKIRIARGKQIRKNYGISAPAYNLKACEWFKNFDIQNNTEGRYAVYGDGEIFLKGVGYFVDYFNEKLKLIIEWDEEFHYNKNNELRKNDIFKQEEIEKAYPKYKFIRIREKEILI